METQHELKDGTPVIIRPIRSEDAPRLSDGLEKLSAETSRQRFLSPKKKLTPAQLTYLTNPDGTEHMAFCLVEILEDGREPEGIGVGRCIRETAGSHTAEVAVTVADRWQGLGGGHLLFSTLRDWGLSHGVTHWTGLMLESNKTAAALMARFGRVVSKRSTAPGIIEILVELEPST